MARLESAGLRAVESAEATDRSNKAEEQLAAAMIRYLRQIVVRYGGDADDIVDTPDLRTRLRLCIQRQLG